MNFFNPVIVRALIGGLIILIPIILMLIREVKPKLKISHCFGVILVVLFFMAIGGTGSFVYVMNSIYGIFYYVIVFSYTTFFILVELYILKFKAAAGLVILLFVIPFVSFIYAVPTAVIPYFRSAINLTSKPIAISSEFNAESFTKRFSRMREALTDIEGKISLETKNIDHSITELTYEIEQRNKQLKDLRDQQASLEDQVEQYKKLASLTQEQTQAVIEVLRKGKYIDYTVGFIIGILSGGIFFALQQLRPQKLNPKFNSKNDYKNI